MEIAIISACAIEQWDVSTTLTPTPAIRPLTVSNTTAPNGPPVRCSTFPRANSITNRIRSSTESRGESSRSTTDSTHVGSSSTILLCLKAFLPSGGFQLCLPDRLVRWARQPRSSVSCCVIIPRPRPSRQRITTTVPSVIVRDLIGSTGRATLHRKCEHQAITVSVSW